MTPVSDIIQKRFSCRSYADKLIEASVLQAFKRMVDQPHRGLFDNAPRFALIAMDALPSEAWKKLGTYGVIKNARLYLAGMISPAPMATCDYGYCKEKLILEATQLGLNTCWLGGTFAISAFGRAAGMRRNELLPTITPLGYAAERRSLTERVMRGFAGSDRRLPWAKLFFCGNASTPLAPQKRALTPKRWKMFGWPLPPPTNNPGGSSMNPTGKFFHFIWRAPSATSICGMFPCRRLISALRCATSI